MSKNWMLLSSRGGALPYGRASAWGMGILLALAVLGSMWGGKVGAQNAQHVQDGEWSASLVKENSNLNVNFGLRSAKAGKHQFGQTYEFSELGLTREQVLNG